MPEIAIICVFLNTYVIEYTQNSKDYLKVYIIIYLILDTLLINATEVNINVLVELKFHN